jgi:hypothetical protein
MESKIKEVQHLIVSVCNALAQPKAQPKTGLRKPLLPNVNVFLTLQLQQKFKTTFGAEISLKTFSNTSFVPR